MRLVPRHVLHVKHTNSRAITFLTSSSKEKNVSPFSRAFPESRADSSDSIDQELDDLLQVRFTYILRNGLNFTIVRNIQPMQRQKGDIPI